MASVENHLSIEDLAARYRACEDVCAARHYQTIWLLAQGHTRLRCILREPMYDRDANPKRGRRLSDAIAGTKHRAYFVLLITRNARPADGTTGFRSVLFCSRQARLYALDDHRPFELGEDAHHLE